MYTKYLVLIGLFALLAGCSSVHETEVAETDIADISRKIPQTHVYNCEGGEFIVRTGPGEIALWYEGTYQILSQTRSASGVRYQEGDIVLWNKDDQTILDVGLHKLRNCQSQPERVPWAEAWRRRTDPPKPDSESGLYSPKDE
ncbi:MAG: MliC family protein [Parahaliea sp.]